MAPTVTLLRLDPSAFRRVVLRRLAIMGGLMLVVSQSLLVGLFLLKGDASVFLGDGIFVVALAFVALQTYGRERAAWSSFELAVTETVLRRQVVGADTIELLRRDVTGISEHPGRGLTVHARDGRALFVPASLTRFEELRDELLSWGPAVPTPGGSHREIVLSLALVGCWLGTGVPDLRIALCFGAAVLALGIRAIRVAQRDRGIDARTKAALYSGYGFLMLAPFARLLVAAITWRLGSS